MNVEICEFFLIKAIFFDKFVLTNRKSCYNIKTKSSEHSPHNEVFFTDMVSIGFLSCRGQKIFRSHFRSALCKRGAMSMRRYCYGKKVESFPLEALGH